MTSDQATALLAQVADLQALVLGLGILGGHILAWLMAANTLGLVGIAFAALRRMR